MERKYLQACPNWVWIIGLFQPNNSIMSLDISFGWQSTWYWVFSTDLPSMRVRDLALRLYLKEAFKTYNYILFKAISDFCFTWIKLIPLNFILAFYVAQVVTRWWAQWNVRLIHIVKLIGIYSIFEGYPLAWWGSILHKCLLSWRWQIQQTNKKNCC